MHPGPSPGATTSNLKSGSLPGIVTRAGSLVGRKAPRMGSGCPDASVRGRVNIRCPRLLCGIVGLKSIHFC